MQLCLWRIIIIIITTTKLVDKFGNYALRVLLPSPQSLLRRLLSHCSVGSFYMLEQKPPHLHGQKSGSSGKRQRKCRTFCEKTSDGTACSSITDTQHVSGWSLHPPDFVTLSETAKNVKLLQLLDWRRGRGRGKKKPKNNIVQRCRLEVLISYPTRNLPSPIFLPMPMHF